MKAYHNDIKPENIMIKNENLYLVDLDSISFEIREWCATSPLYSPFIKVGDHVNDLAYLYECDSYLDIF